MGTAAMVAMAVAWAVTVVDTVAWAVTVADTVAWGAWEAMGIAAAPVLLPAITIDPGLLGVVWTPVRSPKRWR